MSLQEPSTPKDTATVLEQFHATAGKTLGDYSPDHHARQQYNANIASIQPELDQVLRLYKYEEDQLVPVDPNLLTGTTHNDYYKFTMAPVIAWVEQYVGHRVTVTFSIDVRDVALAQRLQRNHNGIVDDIIRALHKLSERKFRPEIVLAAVEGKPISAFWQANSGNLFGSTEAPRTLIRPNRPQGALPDDFHGHTVIYNRPILPSDVADGGVAIAVFERETSKGSINSAEPTRKLYVEATGPWGRCSYLETTMMQAVYQVALRHHMRERKETYGQWLYEALFRCHLSMTFAKEQCRDMSGALFSGRRTGHHIFSLVQVLYHSRFYTGAEGGGKCIGTSSVDAWYVLSKVLGFPGIVPPAGTHAHELSMVIMSLLPALDHNEESLVISQAVGHWLFYRLVHQGFPTPMPMLPDTLGSRAFMKAAASIWVHRMENGVCRDDEAPVRLLSLMTSARQDSGSLSEFKEILADYKELTNEKLGMMASEIDDKDSLQSAYSLGYKTYGTGGFMGDSEKVWPVTETKFSASMAVKAVRVYVEDQRCNYGPIKLGDAVDTVKVTGDTLLPAEDFAAMVQSAVAVKDAAIPSKGGARLAKKEQLLVMAGNRFEISDYRP